MSLIFLVSFNIAALANNLSVTLFANGKMKYLYLSLQSELGCSVTTKDVSTFIESIGYKSEFIEGNDSEKYIIF